MLSNSLRTLKSKIQASFSTTDRRAKIQDGDFIMGLLEATTGASKSFSLAALRLSMCAFLGKFIGQSAFNERMSTPTLTQQIQHALGVLMREASQSRCARPGADLTAKLGVDSVVAVDGSLVSLWSGLAELFSGTFTEASIKLHLAIDLLTGAVEWLDLTPGAVHDSQRFPELHRGRLYIMDLGYWSFKLFSSISSAGGFFLSRLKGSSSLVITGVVSGGFGKSVIGAKLKDLDIQRRRDKTVELAGELRSEKKKLQVRVIGFWHPKDRCYRWHITNLQAPKNVIAQLYRLRWQIELSFKAMKSSFNFDRIPTLSPNATISLALIGVCHYVMSTILRAASHEGDKKKGYQLSILRAAAMLRAFATEIYHCLRAGFRISVARAKEIDDRLLHAIRTYTDPNAGKRKNSMSRLDQKLG